MLEKETFIEITVIASIGNDALISNKTSTHYEQEFKLVNLFNVCSELI